MTHAHARTLSEHARVSSSSISKHAHERPRHHETPVTPITSLSTSMRKSRFSSPAALVDAPAAADDNHVPAVSHAPATRKQSVCDACRATRAAKPAADGCKRRATGISQCPPSHLAPSRRVIFRRPTSRAPLHLERLDVLRDHTTRADRAGMDLPTSESIGPVDPELIRRADQRQGERWGKAEAPRSRPSALSRGGRSRRVR